jgi:ribonuclease HI
MEIYTDGSCLILSHHKASSSPGGWAYVIICNGEIQRKGSGGVKETSSQRMEVKAASEGLRAALFLIDTNESMKSKESILRPDSKYVTNTISNSNSSLEMSKGESIFSGWIFKWLGKDKVISNNRKHYDLWNEIICIIHEIYLRGYVFSCNWIKAHNGNKYNELVNDLAKDMAQIEKQKL